MGGIKGKEKLIEYLAEIKLERKNQKLENKGDEMIYRFHKANLEPPKFFSKSDSSFIGHDKTDAIEWISKHRTSEAITRWLFLYAGKYVCQLFEQEQSIMSANLGVLFNEAINSDTVAASFGQLYDLFYGLRTIDYTPYYQAVTAMLIPFESKLKRDSSFRIMLSWVSKQARNYCAHSYFDAEITSRSALFLITSALISIVNADQETRIEMWLNKVEELVSTRSHYDVAKNLGKIDNIYNLAHPSIHLPDTDYFNYISSKSYADYTPKEIVQAMGFNNALNDQDHETKEKYYIFTLAAYIVKWMAKNEKDSNTKELVERNCSKGMACLFHLSNMIVNDYEYLKP